MEEINKIGVFLVLFGISFSRSRTTNFTLSKLSLQRFCQELAILGGFSNIQGFQRVLNVGQPYLMPFKDQEVFIFRQGKTFRTVRFFRFCQSLLRVSFSSIRVAEYFSDCLNGITAQLSRPIRKSTKPIPSLQKQIKALCRCRCMRLLL